MQRVEIKQAVSRDYDEQTAREGRFRIVEKIGRFTIQKKVERTFGWFKKRKITGWEPIDINGYPMLNHTYQMPLGSFDSLEKARKKVESIKKGVVIHEC